MKALWTIMVASSLLSFGMNVSVADEAEFYRVCNMIESDVPEEYSPSMRSGTGHGPSYPGQQGERLRFCWEDAEGTQKHASVWLQNAKFVRDSSTSVVLVAAMFNGKPIVAPNWLTNNNGDTFDELAGVLVRVPDRFAKLAEAGFNDSP